MAPRRIKGEAENPFEEQEDNLRANATYTETTRAFFGNYDTAERQQTKTLKLHNDKAMEIDKFRLTPVGLVINGAPTEQEWSSLGEILRRMEASIQWLIGDWLVFGEREYKETYAKTVEATGYDYGTLRTYAYVCSKVDLSIRIDKLSFAHHQLVAPFQLPDGSPDTEKQAEWLQKAVENEWSIAQMREAMSRKRQIVEPFISPKFDKSLLTLLGEYKKLEGEQRRRAIEYLERTLEEMRKNL